MSGEKINQLNFAVKEALPAMRKEADENPNAQVFVRALRFSKGAEWINSDPVPVEQFQWADLPAGGPTDMGKALSMVDAYATTLATLTLAVHREHFLLEDSASNSVLSLHPAIHFSGKADPDLCTELEGFSTSSDKMEVTWKPIQGIQMTSSLKVVKPLHLQLTLRALNIGNAPVDVAALLPLCVRMEQPGACALGMHELRTLGAIKVGRPLRLRKVQGKSIVSLNFGAWFAQLGNPCLFLGALADASPVPEIRTEGARGKILSLGVRCPVASEQIAPGESVEVSSFLLIIGNVDVRDAIETWQELTSADLTVQPVPDFKSSDPIDDNEPEEEPEEVAEEEPVTAEVTDAAESEGAPEEAPVEASEPEPAEASEAAEVEETAATEEMQEETSEEAAEETANQEEEPESAEPVEAEPELETAISEPAEAESEVEETLAFAEAREEIGAAEGHSPLLKPSRTAAFQRAFRRTEGIVWPRWAAGRRHLPQSGPSSRSRRNWRWKAPASEENA
jgi:hypothetical protein